MAPEEWKIVMSQTLDDVLFGDPSSDELQEEMRPDRIAGGRLDTLTIRVRIGKTKADAVSAPSGPFLGCVQAPDVASHVSGSLGPAETRRFLRWLADSVDNDVPMINLQVIAASGDAPSVQNAARRLAHQAFA